MASLYYDVISLLPKWGDPRSEVQPMPTIGQQAPLPDDVRSVENHIWTESALILYFDLL